MNPIVKVLGAGLVAGLCITAASAQTTLSQSARMAVERHLIEMRRAQAQNEQEGVQERVQQGVQTSQQAQNNPADLPPQATQAPRDADRRNVRPMAAGAARSRNLRVPLRLQIAAETDSASAAEQRHEAETVDLLREGRAIFRLDTFGNEGFWSDGLGLHLALAGEQGGGVGPGLPPETALALGLKVDADALPASLLDDLRRGRVDLGDPATTLALLEEDAVVGVRGAFDNAGALQAVGITCALCHSTVDDRVAPGIGHRLDGWANRDLDIGAIIALAPELGPFVERLNVVDPAIDAATVRAVLESWGPGRFDATLLLDGQAFRPDGGSASVLIPPAFGLAGVNLHTWTGWGGVSHWNALVANIEMGGQGTFIDRRLNDPVKFPIAAAFGLDDIRNDPDLVTSKLPALHFYQMSLTAPEPPPGSFDEARAAEGQALFAGRAQCATCHVPPLFTEPGWNMHTPADIGIDGFQAERSPDEHYRTAPLAGLWTHGQGGYYHDGRFATLRDVIEHYDDHFFLNLTDEDMLNLEEYLKSI